MKLKVMGKVVGVFKYFNGTKNIYINNLVSDLLVSGIKKEEIFILSEDFSYNKNVNVKPFHYEKSNSKVLSGIIKNFDEPEHKSFTPYNHKNNAADNEFISLMIKGSFLGGCIGFLIGMIILLITPNIFELLLSESAITIFSCFFSCISLGIIIGMITSMLRNEQKNNDIITIVYTTRYKEESVRNIFKKHYSFNIKTYH